MYSASEALKRRKKNYEDDKEDGDEESEATTRVIAEAVRPHSRNLAVVAEFLYRSDSEVERGFICKQNELFHRCIMKPYIVGVKRINGICFRDVELALVVGSPE